MSTEFTISINPVTLAGIVCAVLGLVSIIRCVVYLSISKQWDFFSPILGGLAGILGIIEIIVGVVLCTLSASPGVIVLAWLLAAATAFHTVLGFIFVRDARR